MTLEQVAGTRSDRKATTVDVVILGGGLAGLTLALQIRGRCPDLSVLVLERRTHPVPSVTHKVGESTVEIGATYFGTVLGLKEHLAQHQLRKFGFRFYVSDRRYDFDRVDELGASRYLNVPTYQIDRGVFENYLGTVARERGVDFRDGATVRELKLSATAELSPAETRTSGDEPHVVRFVEAGSEHVVMSRWVVDATGRAGLLKRQLGLAEDNGHNANAVWFRIAARIDLDDWSVDPAWLQRCVPPDRWLATNHLCGDGYWVWLIPLASGAHSIGIVADPRTHPLNTMNTFDRAMAWLHRHQPRLAADLEGKRDTLQDFQAFRNFSYGSREFFSASRWALTGEAGAFLDPFYSPGSDFIAIANTYISDLIAKDSAGEPFGLYVSIYQDLYRSFYETTLTLYENQYHIFGSPQVLPLKVIWDFSYYWGILCQLFFQRRLTDVAALGRLRGILTESYLLNAALQRLFGAWAKVSREDNDATLLDLATLDWFVELNRSLNDQLDEAGFNARIRDSATLLKRLAATIVDQAAASAPDLDVAEVAAYLSDADRRKPVALFPCSVPVARAGQAVS